MRFLGLNMSKDKSKTWLNSGEYLTQIDEARTNILKGAASSENEAQTAAIFQQEIYYLIRSKTGIRIDYQSEHSVGCISHKFGSLLARTSGHGRLDAVVNDLVIEYKHHSKLSNISQFNTAAEQVRDYLKALLVSDGIKYNAILTDGLRISYFTFVDDEIKNSNLCPLEAKDIDMIVKAILYNSKKRFVPSNILKDFSISLTAPSISKSIAVSLFNSLKNSPTEKTKMLFTEWTSLMHLSTEDNGKGSDIEKRRKDLSLIFSETIDNPDVEYLALYALQTTYAIIVKLIACKVVEKLDYNESTGTFFDLTNVSSVELQKFFEKMEDGYSYRSSNINNFLEGDFFSWYSDKDQWSTEFWTLILTVIKAIDEYSAFSFNVFYLPVDIFKDLYLSIIPRSIRHSMGEYFTPEWLADYVVTQAIESIDNKDNWKAIDPCCGSGIFVISLIKHIVGNKDIQSLTENEKKNLLNSILNRVYGIDINPLSILSARVGYYLALLPFGEIKDLEIPVYLGDSAIIPQKEVLDGIECYKYSVTNEKAPFDIVLPARLVKTPDFGNTMSQLQSCVKTDDSGILQEVIKSKLNDEEKASHAVMAAIKLFSDKLVYLHKNSWDGIWVRIATNFMLIARLQNFDLIVGNPPWVKWEHLPAAYARKIKELCNIKHIFSNDGGQFGGTQLNICALISNVAATNWLNKKGILAFLMPDSIMSQNSYEEFRNFYIDYETKTRLYLQKLDKWEAPLRPFRCDDKPITQDFNTYYFGYDVVDYSIGFKVEVITRKKTISDDQLNMNTSFEKAKEGLIISETKAKQLTKKSTAFSYENAKFDFSKIIGKTNYLYRTGVEFTPQELYMLVGVGPSSTSGNYRFNSKKFMLSKYVIDDTPSGGWDLPYKHIYPIVTGPSITPFKNEDRNEFAIIPYDESNTKNPVPSSYLIAEENKLFAYLVNHKSLIDQQSEKSKQMHRGNEFYALSKIGPYTFADYIVAARDNSKFCATVICKKETPWGETKQNIGVKHTILISQDINGRFITKDEAYYICGILNSSIVISYIESSFKSNGYSLNKSNICIPLFDKDDSNHCKIKNLALEATTASEARIKDIQDEITELFINICSKK